jgi:predicted alpha-1,2-mannosidase
MGNYVVYFYGELEASPSASGTWKNQQITADTLSERWGAEGDRVGAWWRFSTKAGEVVRLKLAVSFHSIEKARDYLRLEIPDWNMQTVSNAGRAEWNNALGRIEVKGGDEAQRTRFYTALYHAQLMPRNRTGDLARFTATVPMWDDQYAVWDTWRTKFPLMLLIEPEMVRGNIASFVERLRVDGQVRDTFSAGWGGTKSPPEVVSAETVVNSLRCQEDQGGNDVDNIIADAYVKGLRGVDWQAAYGVLDHNAEHERKGTAPDSAHAYRRQGWIPAGTMSVSNTQEYAYNDFVASQVAHGLGREADAQRYLTRSRQWQQLFNFDAKSDGFKGFVAPRTEAGQWPEFDLKKYPGSWDLYFYEANSWTYSFFAPHQSGLLVEWMGGRERFVARLAHAQAANLIQFDNEPGFLAPFLFHYAGRPDLAARSVREVLRQRFNGLSYPGDDDSGAMSSYYVWAALGLFPNAGQDFYFLNGPLFEHISVHRPEEGKLEISRNGKGDFVASVTLNGKPLNRSWCRHSEIKGDTKLVFTMCETPGGWGTMDPPPSDNFPATPMPAYPLDKSP